VAGLDDGEGEADAGGCGLGLFAELGGRILGQPDDPRVVAEVVLGELGVAVESELAYDGPVEGADQEVGEQVGAGLLVEEGRQPGLAGEQVVAVQPGQPAQAELGAP
jgi:hypothetical protein